MTKEHDVAELRRLAEWAVPSEHRPTRVEIEPFQPALYDSRELAGADEVALSIRLGHREGWDQRRSRWSCSDGGSPTHAGGHRRLGGDGCGVAGRFRARRPHSIDRTPLVPEVRPLRTAPPHLPALRSRGAPYLRRPIGGVS